LLARRKEVNVSRPKKTTAQRRAERFESLYRVGKARLGVGDLEIAAMIGVSRPTLHSYKQNPGRLPLEKAAILWTAMGWTSDEISSVLFPERNTPPGVSSTRRGA